MPSTENPVYQTLEDFYRHPFGVAVYDTETSLDPKYRKHQNLISLHSYSILEDSYYMHIKIPSVSSPGKFYDVVIQFIPPSDDVKSDDRLDNYVIQFFSNSPGFIFKYAVLYKNHGYMIDALQSKMDKEYADKLPTQTNKDMKLSVDSSIYFAVKFLYTNRMAYLSKKAIKHQKQVPFETLIKDVVGNKEMLSKTVKDIMEDAIKEGKIDKSKIEKKAKKDVKRIRSTKPFIPKRAKLSRTRSTVTDEDGLKHVPIKKRANKKIVPTRSTRKR